MKRLLKTFGWVGERKPSPESEAMSGLCPFTSEMCGNGVCINRGSLSWWLDIQNVLDAWTVCFML